MIYIKTVDSVKGALYSNSEYPLLFTSEQLARILHITAGINGMCLSPVSRRKTHPAIVIQSGDSFIVQFQLIPLEDLR